MNMEQLNRIEQKIDRLGEKVSDIHATTKAQQVLIDRNTQDLEQHMARSDASEARLDVMEQWAVEGRTHLRTVHKVAGWLFGGGFLGIVTLLLRLFDII